MGMTKNNTYFSILIFSFIFSLPFKIIGAESPWVKDGQSEDGRIKLKNENTGEIKWSSEHLDPLARKPNLGSSEWINDNLWLAHKYSRTIKQIKNFSYWVVNPQGIHGSIVGTYEYPESEKQAPKPFKILYFQGDIQISEGEYASALDSALNVFSNFNGLDFSEFEIAIDYQHSVLAKIIQQIREDENKLSTTGSSISAIYTSLTQGRREEIRQAMRDYFQDGDALVTETLKRRSSLQKK
jgi:hypothetical protein